MTESSWRGTTYTCLFTSERERTTNWSDNCANVQFGKPMCFYWALGLLRDIWMRGSLQAQVWFKSSCSTQKLTLTQVTPHESFNGEALCTAFEQFRSPGIFPLSSLSVLWPLPEHWLLLCIPPDKVPQESSKCLLSFCLPPKSYEPPFSPRGNA